MTPGLAAPVQVKVKNTGTVVDQFTLDVLGDSNAWATIEPPTLSLFPGAEGSATVTFSPPRSSRVAAGSMPFGIRVQSKEDPAGSTVEEGTIDVGAFSEPFVELVPKTSRGSTGATHDVAIDNRGNVPLDATLTATDADRLLAFEVRPPGVVAAPGTAAFAKVRVKPRRTFWRGPSMSRPFQLQADVPGVAPIVIDGSMLQTAILPAWTMRAVVALIALIVLATAAWLFLLKPAIESSARAQAQDVLAAAGITPGPSSGGGSGGGGSSGGSGSPSAGASGSASATPASSPTPAPTPSLSALAGGTPVDGRLLGGGSPATAPAGKGLYITDLVFSNPSATATGDIQLRRAGQILLALRLENFRDLDFHFVTPIVVTGSQKLALVCPTGCSGASLYYSGFTR